MDVKVLISQIFGSIKTAMIDIFDERYTSVIEVVVVVSTAAIIAMGLLGRGMVQYWDFNNTKPPEFDGFKDPTVSISQLYDVEGCFFTFLCTEDQKVKFSLNLISLGEKDWWKLVIGAFSLMESVIVTQEHFTDIFHAEYVPLVESDRLDQEYMSLKQTMDR